MKDEVKKIINFRFDRYKETENKLEKLAAKGLVLDRCGTFLWTFRKGEPKNLKYTITYFYEGSIFNPGITDNQSRYFDYAKAAGWNFVTQMDQMQIFSSEEDNPIPFETDEKEKFDNIKRCMRKIFLPSTIIMLLIFIFNLVVQFNSFKLNPIDFLSNPSKLVPALVILQIIIYEVYSLFNYFIWCKCQERSIADGGECTENRSMMHMGIDITFMCFIFGSFFYLFILHMLI